MPSITKNFLLAVVIAITLCMSVVVLVLIIRQPSPAIITVDVSQAINGDAMNIDEERWPTRSVQVEGQVIIILPGPAQIRVCAATLAWTGSASRAQSVAVLGCIADRAATGVALSDLFVQLEGVKGFPPLRGDADMFVQRFVTGAIMAPGERVLVGVLEQRPRVVCYLRSVDKIVDMWEIDLEIEW